MREFRQIPPNSSGKISVPPRTPTATNEEFSIRRDMNFDSIRSCPVHGTCHRIKSDGRI